MGKFKIKTLILFGLVCYVFLTICFLSSFQKTEPEADDTKNTEVHILARLKHTADVSNHRTRELDLKMKTRTLQIKKEQEHHKGHDKKEQERYKGHERRDFSSRRKSLSGYLKPSAINNNFTEIEPGLLIYSAFFDDRYDSAYIRLVAVAPSGKNKDVSGLYCVFRSGIKEQLVYYETCENHLRRNSFYFLSCPVPTSVATTFKGITAMAIAPSVDAKAPEYKFITVVNNRYSKGSKSKVMGDFAVCVPPLFGTIKVLRLVEFIELSSLLGSVHFTFYVQNVPDEIHLLLEFYKRQGLVTVLPWRLPEEDAYIWYKGQSAAIGDCLLRNLHINNLVAFNDIDEFIMPHATRSWKDLVDLLKYNVDLSGKNPDHIAVYRFQSTYYEATAPKDMDAKQNNSIVSKFLTLSRTRRSSGFSNLRTKMIAYPARVFELGIHHLSKQSKEEFFNLDVEPEQGYVHHYRECDNMWGMHCGEYLIDKSVLLFKNALVRNVIARLKQIKEIET